MFRGLRGFSLALLGVAAFVAVPAMAQAPATQPAKYMRFVDRGDSVGGELDTADVTFTNDSGVTVHLIAAVHIGERAYYDNLSMSFASYDKVLYELIKDRDAAPPGGNGAGEKSDSTISTLQVFLKNSLDLDFQLDDIDYTKTNFVHADLDRETFEKMEADRGESIWTLMIQEAIKQWGDQASKDQTPDADEQMKQIVQLMCRPDGRRQFKLMLARDMDQLDLESTGMDGPGGSVILTERNKAAMAALDTVLAGGAKKIAIFYGAAHMPDLSQRLAARGFHPVDTQWRTAWDLTIRPDQPSMVESMLNGLIDSMNGK